MTYEEKMQIVEAARVLKKNCDKIFSTGKCVGCDFFNEDKRDCDLYKFPTFWEIPTLRGVGMRKILFRGKRKDNGKWVEGYYAGYGLICPNEPEDTYNATGDYCGMTPYVGFVEVDNSTVGQYTGLTDKNGKKIFEGDVVRLPHAKSPFEIKYIESRARFLGVNNKEELMSMLGSSSDFEVIGTTYDNQELLKNGE